jgi:hypothetical protein
MTCGNTKLRVQSALALYGCLCPVYSFAQSTVVHGRGTNTQPYYVVYCDRVHTHNPSTYTYPRASSLMPLRPVCLGLSKVLAP